MSYEIAALGEMMIPTFLGHTREELMEMLLAWAKDRREATMSKLRQQGDVLLFSAEEVPAGAKKLAHLVLQEGEHTGHAHRVSSGLAELFETGSTKYLKVLSDEAVITHEEHKPVTLPKGTYKIGIVKEYDHFTEEIRQIRD